MGLVWNWWGCEGGGYCTNYDGRQAMKRALKLHRLKALLFTLQEAYTQIEECGRGSSARLLLDRLQSEIERISVRIKRMEDGR